MNAFTKLLQFDKKTGELNIILETRRGCRAVASAQSQHWSSK